MSLHPERLEDLLSGKQIQRLSADAPDDVAEQEEVDVAVDEPLAGRRCWHLLDRQRDRRRRSRSTSSPRSTSGRSPDTCVSRWRIGDVALAVALEARDEDRDAVAQPDPALLHQHHHAGRGRHHLRQRRKIEDRVERHRFEHPAPARGDRTPSGTARDRRGRPGPPRRAASSRRSPRWTSGSIASSRLHDRWLRASGDARCRGSCGADSAGRRSARGTDSTCH